MPAVHAEDVQTKTFVITQKDNLNGSQLTSVFLLILTLFCGLIYRDNFFQKEVTFNERKF